jgi:hypothetical protein
MAGFQRSDAVPLRGRQVSAAQIPQFQSENERPALGGLFYCFISGGWFGGFQALLAFAQSRVPN